MYTLLAEKKVQELKDNSQYRDFTTIDRICKQYPLARCLNTNNEVIVWCSNDYLGDEEHDLVSPRYRALFLNHLCDEEHFGLPAATRHVFLNHLCDDLKEFLSKFKTTYFVVKRLY